MGGVIALTIRLPDGTEHRMQRWTNITPDLVHDPKFLNGDVKIAEDVIQHWLTESAKKSNGVTLISSWQMYKHPYLAPSEYGILLIDYAKKTIVDCQGYVDVLTIMDIQPEYKTLKAAGLLGKKVYDDKSAKFPMRIYEVKHPAWTIFKTKSFIDAKAKILELGFVLSPTEEKIWNAKIKDGGAP